MQLHDRMDEQDSETELFFPFLLGSSSIHGCQKGESIPLRGGTLFHVLPVSQEDVSFQTRSESLFSAPVPEKKRTVESR